MQLLCHNQGTLQEVALLSPPGLTPPAAPSPHPTPTSPLVPLPLPALLSFCSFSVCGDGRVSPGQGPHPAAHPGEGSGGFGGVPTRYWNSQTSPSWGLSPARSVLLLDVRMLNLRNLRGRDGRWERVRTPEGGCEGDRDPRGMQMGVGTPPGMAGVVQDTPQGLWDQNPRGATSSALPALTL